MPWWEILDHPSLDTIGGILAWAAVLTAVLVALALFLAFLWHRVRDERKKRRLAEERAAARAEREPPSSR